MAAPLQPSIEMSEVLIQKWNTASSLAATCTDDLAYIIGNSTVQPPG